MKKNKNNFYLMLLILFPIYSFSAGMTTHQLISFWVENGSHQDLQTLLKKNQNDFRNGTIFPDLADQYIKSLNKYDFHKKSDDLSHGIKYVGTKNSKYVQSLEDGSRREAGGMINEYFKLMKKSCGNTIITKDKRCQEAYSFWIGMVSHVVADVPWHREWIVSTTDTNKKSDPKDNDLETRHKYADNDVDICLAKVINDVKVTHHAHVKKIRKNKHVGQGCKDVHGFWDLHGGNGLLGACYKCPKGYHHDKLHGVTSKKICYKKDYGICNDIKLKDLRKIGPLPIPNRLTNALSFGVPSVVGNTFAQNAFAKMDKEYPGVKQHINAVGLMHYTEKTILTKLIPEQLAKKSNMKDKKQHYKNAYKQVAYGQGGLKDTYHVTLNFVNKVWSLTKQGKHLQIVRLDDHGGLKRLNHGILVDKKFVHKLY